MALDLTDYKLLSFDIYGTLIDWQTGIYEALKPLIDQLPPDSKNRESSATETRKLILRAYSSQERALQSEQPKLAYNKILAETHKRLSQELIGRPSTDAEGQKFSASLGSYAPFPDTVAAMKVLGSHYKLIALSNVDNESFSHTLSGPLNGVKFDGIYTAQDIGSYKPNLNNFRYLIENVKKEFGVEKHEILHTAHSLMHDHVPAKETGLRPGVWIARAGAKGEGIVTGPSLKDLEGEGKVELGAVYESLGDMAAAVTTAFEAKK